MRIRTGITDGTLTEVIEGDLHAGDALITEMSSGADDKPPDGRSTGRGSRPGEGSGAFSEASMSESPALLELDAVTKTYHLGDVAVQVLHGVTLRIEPGESVAIMGASGSGKSTLMNILGCLDRPTAGHYLLAGRDVSRLSRDELAEVRNRTIGFVFQNFNLLSRTSALENVELPLDLRGRGDARARRERAKAALERVGLGRKARPSSEPALGRPAAARRHRARAGHEPQAHPGRRADGQPRLAHQRRDHGALPGARRSGITVVLVTHESDIAAYARRVIVLERRPRQRRPSARTGARRAAAPAPEGEDGMNPLLTFRLALRALLRNKMRSFLTMLGIIIGVSAVIAMVAIGEGAKAQVEKSFAAMGTSLLIVMSGSSSRRAARAAASARSPR